MNTSVLSETIDQTLARRDNDYRPHHREWTRRTGLAWSAPAPAGTRVVPISVVIPMRNRATVITTVLDALAASAEVDFEIIVIDDASADDGAFRAAAHPLGPTVVRLAQPLGSSVARNIGTALATTDTVLYLDADMVLPSTLLREFTARTCDDLILLGFRQHVPVAALNTGPLALSVPDIRDDPRVECVLSAGMLPFSRTLLDKPRVVRLLDETDDLLGLGNGRFVGDWSLPRTVVTAMVAMPRQAVIDTGGFHPGFDGLWGAEDAYVGAKLIAAGCKVTPVRSAVGFHIDLPDTPAENRRKQESLPRTVAFYRSLLAQPLPLGGADWFHDHTSVILRESTIVH